MEPIARIQIIMRMTTEGMAIMLNATTTSIVTTPQNAFMSNTPATQKNPSEREHHEHDHHEHGPHEHTSELVVTHDHRDDHAIWGFFGASLGLVTLSLFEDLPTISASAGRVFISLALEAAPALLLAYAFAGLLNALLLERTLSWLAAGDSLKQATKGVAFGLPLPICSCGVVLYQTLVQRGVPGTAALAFLISTPEIGVDAILISLPLLGGELTVIRVAAAVFVALGLALLLGPRIKPKTEQIAPQQLKTESLRARIQTGLRYGFGPLVDHTLPWMLVGLSIAAYAAPLFDAQTIAALSPFWQVPVFALLGIPMYVCASCRNTARSDRHHAPSVARRRAGLPAHWPSNQCHHFWGSPRTSWTQHCHSFWYSRSLTLHCVGLADKLDVFGCASFI